MSSQKGRGMLQDAGEPEKVAEKANGIFPDELVLKIFCHLPKHDLLGRAALVCKDWARLAMDPSLWTEVELHAAMLTRERARQLIKHMTRLRKVRLIRWGPPTIFVDELLCLIAKLHPKLEVLELKWCAIHRLDSFQRVAESCTDMKELAITKGRGYSTLPSRSHIFTLCERSPNLQKLTLENNRYTGYLWAREIYWPYLREVHLTFLSHSADAELEVVCRSAAGTLQKLWIRSVVGAEALVHLSQCTLLEDLGLLVKTSENIDSTLARLGNLRRLDLGVVRMDDDSDIVSLLSQQAVVQKLERIEFSRTFEISDQCLSLIAENCPELTSLSLINDEITKYGLADLLTYANKLESLELHTDCSEITTSALDELRSFFPAVTITEVESMWDAPAEFLNY